MVFTGHPNASVMGAPYCDRYALQLSERLLLKVKNTPVGQYILEGLDESEDPYDYIENLMPLIGEVVLFFNALESDLDHIICNIISDRTDQPGLLVLHNMMFAKKVELYQRFSSDFLRITNLNIPNHKELISSLKECGVLRNRIVHANWQYTDDDGFTQVRIKMQKDGLEHECWQFSIESMQKVIDKIFNTRELLEKFEDECTKKVTMLNAVNNKCKF